MMAHDDGPPTDASLYELLASTDREAARVRPLVPAVLEGAQGAGCARGATTTPPGRRSSRTRRAAGSCRPAPTPPRPSSPPWLAKRRAAMDAGEDLHWCIADRHSDRALGNVQLFGLRRPGRDHDAELGYGWQAAARGRGVMDEVLQLLLPHAFAGRAEGGLGLRRLHAGTVGGNAASQGGAGTGRVHPGRRRARRHRPGRRRVRRRRAVRAARTGRPPPAGAGGGETLEGAAVRLRAWRRTDDERVRQACTDPVTHHWLGGSLPSPYTVHEARGYLRGRAAALREGSELSWCVADPETDECLGAVSVMHLLEPDGTGGEIGYWAHPEARGRGVTTEAVRLAVRHAFVPRADGGLDGDACGSTSPTATTPPERWRYAAASSRSGATGRPSRWATARTSTCSVTTCSSRSTTHAGTARNAAAWGWPGRRTRRTGTARRRSSRPRCSRR